LDLGVGTSAADNAAADELAAELNALLSPSSGGTTPFRQLKSGPRQQKMAKGVGKTINVSLDVESLIQQVYPK